MCHVASGILISGAFIFLAYIKRWVWAFRKDRLPVAVYTNNGVERLNEDFKYKFLASHRDKTLSGMLSILVTEFIPDKYSRYRLFQLFIMNTAWHANVITFEHTFRPSSLSIYPSVMNILFINVLLR